MRVFFSVVFILSLSACHPKEAAEFPGRPIDQSFAGEYEEAAEKILSLSPNGVAIGEVHGQQEGVAFLKAVVAAAIARKEAIVLLLELTPGEAGLNPDVIPLSDFRAIDMTDKNLPFWTENSDMRATWELYNYILELTDVPGVEISYFLDPRLYPPPNKLKAHGLAERWQVTKQARPKSYIISWSGNYHTSVEENYPLDVTNSLCRYLEETYGYKPTCLSIDNRDASKDPCAARVEADVLKGEDVFEKWDYVIRRPDRCTRKSAWIGNSKK